MAEGKAGTGEDGGNRDRLATIRAAIDDELRKGARPDPEAWAARHPELAEEVRTLVELRCFLSDEGLLESGPEESDDGLLAGIEAELQDALNRGESPDLVAYQARHPALAPRIEEVAKTLEAVEEALTGAAPSAAALTVADHGALRNYRLHRRLAALPAGPILLASVSGDPRDLVELLVLRPTVPVEAARALFREVEQLRALGIPEIVPLREVGDVRGVRFVVWEHVKGTSLEEAILEIAFHGGARALDDVIPPRGHLVMASDDAEDVAEARRQAPAAAARLARNERHCRLAAALAARVARLLAMLHAAGHVHRDLAPAGVVLDAAGSPRLRWVGLGRASLPFEALEEGTPVHLAPERAAPHTALGDWRPDVYGVGALLYSMLAADAPHRATKRRPDLARILAADPRALAAAAPGLPAALLRLVETAMARDPGTRPPHCEALADALERFAGAAAPAAAPPAPRPLRAPPEGRWSRWRRLLTGRP